MLFESRRLHAAARKGKTRDMQRLLRSGGRVNTKHRETGEIPLHAAAKHNHANMVRFLVDQGSRINTKDMEGRTPLYLASKYKSSGAVSSLLNRGAMTEAKTYDGETPLHAASKRGHHNIATLLLNKGANIHAINRLHTRTPLHNAVMHRQHRMVRLLLNRGANPNAQDLTGKTALHIAVQMGDTEMVRMLLEAGASTSRLDNQRKKPLTYAVEQKNRAIVLLFVEHGAVNMTNGARGILSSFMTGPPQFPYRTGHVRFVENVMATQPRLWQQYLSHSPQRRTPPSIQRPRQPRMQLRLHNNANGVDVVSFNKVPLNDARIIHRRGSSNRIRHIFHKNTISGLLRGSNPRHPFTQQQFSYDDVHHLKDVLSNTDKQHYAKMNSTRTYGMVSKR
jgi:ankyrin repeat protein